jgi:hypothetical protein
MFPTRRFCHYAASLAVGMAAAAALAGCSPRKVEEQSQVVDGVKFDYGLVAEAAGGGPPAGHPESAMHGGAPAHPNTYHVVLSVADAKTGAKLEPVEAAMSLSGTGHPGKSSVTMERMTVNGQVSFGRYVQLPARGPYDLEFQVRRSGQHQPIRARFKLERPS